MYTGVNIGAKTVSIFTIIHYYYSPRVMEHTTHAAEKDGTISYRRFAPAFPVGWSDSITNSDGEQIPV